ncbi:MAG: hypothetical protein KAJ12_10570 [Bacteroidetes bacterium]|nr:hypothetical protein [Bacteroidota bacterium]
MDTRYRLSRLYLAASILLTLSVPSCVIVGMTEHRVEFRKDGTGRAWLRLTDIRSDGATDSALARDFAIMMDSFEKEGIDDFEKGGRKVTNRRFIVHGDTLSAEIEYTFDSLEAVEGLNVTEQEIFIIVPAGREVVRTNGKIGVGEGGSLRIVWDRHAEIILYNIREKGSLPGVSLASHYVAHAQE